MDKADSIEVEMDRIGPAVFFGVKASAELGRPEGRKDSEKYGRGAAFIQSIHLKTLSHFPQTKTNIHSKP